MVTQQSTTKKPAVKMAKQSVKKASVKKTAAKTGIKKEQSMPMVFVD